MPLIAEATNVFIEGEARRERVFRDGARFRLRGSDQRLSLAEVEALGNENPSRLSPNVLLRPVVESFLLPTLSYVAGPGEMAYLPQTAPMFEGHGIEMPVVHPRVSLAVVERKVGKVLGKFHLDIDDMSQPHQETRGETRPGEPAQRCPVRTGDAQESRGREHRPPSRLGFPNRPHALGPGSGFS